MKTNHIAILLDRSTSTRGIAPKLIEQFNQQVALITERSAAENQKTHLSLYTFSSAADRPLLFEAPLDLINVKPMTRNSYVVEGNTAMLDSIGMAIEDLQLFHRDLRNFDHSFLIIVLTDGEENVSAKYNKHTLRDLMNQKVRTDVWSFAFLVPQGGRRNLIQNFDIPEGNIQEWDTTAAGVDVMQRKTSTALSNYFTARTSGMRSTGSFFTDLAGVSVQQVKQNLDEVTGMFWSTPVTRDSSIRDFCEARLGVTYQTGNAYYELTKPEAVQHHKKVVVEHRVSGKRYSGPDARRLLGLPDGGEVRVRPGDHGDWKIFIQSTSVNRKLMAGTTVLYYKG